MKSTKELDDLMATEFISPGDYCVVDGKFVRKLTQEEITERLGGEEGRKAFSRAMLDMNSYPANFSE